ncbi:MAG TPA: ATP-binding protein [Polyangiaceae bacterium]|nr:ATP-binding protein [Polyangiaceae bacterium]
MGYLSAVSRPAPPEGPPGTVERELNVAKLSLFARRALVNATTTAANALLLCALLYPTAPRLWLGLWGALQLGGAFWFSRRSRKPRRPPRGSERGLRRAIVFCTLAGGSLGSVVLLVEGSSDVTRLLVFVTLAAMASAASTTLAAIPRAAQGYIGGALLVPTLFWLHEGQLEYVILALLSVSMTAFLVFNARVTNEAFLEGFARARQMEALSARFQAEQAEWLDLSQGSEAFALLDADAHVLLWNHRFEQVMLPGAVQRGSPYRELLANCALQPSTVDGAPVTTSDWLALRMGLARRDTELLEGYPGEVFYRVSARTLPSGRQAVLAVNVSALKQAENALHERELALLRAQRQESIGVIAGGVAHDFNNLLTAVGGAAEMLSAEVRSPEAVSLVQDILTSVERGSRLARQLLAYGRKQTLKPRSLDLNELLSGRLALFRRLLPTTIQIETEFEPALWSILADPEQIEQVAMNLVLNARDAMPRGGVLRLRTRNIAPACVEFQVEDTGVGMSQETAERAFEPFFSTKSENRGSGLGLSAVQGIVRQSGGTVTLDTGQGRGTRIIVALPRSEAPALPSTLPQDQERPERSPSAAHLLVVDDEVLVLEVTTRLLRRLGYTVSAASRPSDALELLTREGGKVSLLLTDVVMADMNGADLAAAARRMQPDLPVVFMSGYDPGLVAQFETHDVLHKPFSREQLGRAIKAALSGEPLPEAAVPTPADPG